MTQQNSNYYYYYDEKYDDLTIRKKNTVSDSSDEIYDDIYVYRDENNAIVGAQILFYKNRAKTILKKYLPRSIYRLLRKLDRQIY